MRLATFLQSAPPLHVFALGEEALLYGRLSRARDALARIERCELPESWYQLGPVGLLQLDKHALVGALGVINKVLDKPATRSSLVVPNSWVRSLVIEPGPLPRDHQEAEDVVRWRLKKLLPCRPEEVRLDFVASNGSDRVLVLLALDKPFTVLEECFAGAGIRLGRIEPAVLALARVLPFSEEPIMVVSLEPRVLALALVARGKVVLVRHKPLPSVAGHALVARELTRTVAHLSGEGDLGATLRVVLACDDDALSQAVESWALGEVGVHLEAMSAGPQSVARVPGARVAELWALLAVGSGGV